MRKNNDAKCWHNYASLFPLMDARAGRGKWMSKVLESLVVGEVWQKTAFQLIK